MQLRYMAWALVGGSIMASQGPSLVAADVPISTMPSLTGGGVVSTLVAVAHASTSKEALSSSPPPSSSTLSRWSFLKWRRRSTAPVQKTTPWFIPAKMMREEEEVGEGAGGGATTAAMQEEEDGEHDAPVRMSFSMTEEEEITTTTTTRFGSSMQDLSSSSSIISSSDEIADELLGTAKEAIAEVQAIVDEAEAQIEAEETVEEEAYAAAAAAEAAAQAAAPPRPPPTHARTSFLKPRARHTGATKWKNADDEDSIPCGRSLSSALSVIGGGLPLRRGGSTMGAAITSSSPSSSSSSSSFSLSAARSVSNTYFSTASTRTKVYHAEEEVVQEARERGATRAQTVAEEEEEEEEISVSLTTVSSSPPPPSCTSFSQGAAVTIETTVRAVEGQAHAVAAAAAAAAAAAGTKLDEEVTREAELAERFHAETAKQVAGLTSEQRKSLERVREALYGAKVCEKRVRAVDELAVCGDRDAMMLSFLQRKNYDAEMALKSFERVISWRMENGIEDVFEEGRLAREKVEKHRECWPTAFYFTKDEEGDPVFVDRMGILELAKLRKGDVQLDMQDMVLYYVQTMEGRRRLLFPHLSRQSGRHITSYVSVVDVSHFGPQHFGRHALSFLAAIGAVHDDTYSDLVKSMYIINAPFFFHKVFHLISCMMNQELKDRLKVLNRKQSLVELSKIMPSEVAQAIVEGDHEKEREGERELHTFLDGAAREGLHKRRWGSETT